MRSLFAVLLVLGWSVLSWPAAAAVKTAVPETDDDAEEIALFVLANTAFTLYHEFGHALVHELELPVLGREEDAVDNLATFVMMPDEDEDPDDADLILAAADGWLLSHDGQDGDLAFWDEHGLDLQRFYSIVCLVYGSNPDRYADLADDAELPEERRASCPRDYETMTRSWLKVLDPHLATPKKSGAKVRVVIDPPPPRQQHLYALLSETKVAEDIAKDIQATFVLPRPLTLRVKSCGEANAYWEPERRSVTLCYELMAYFKTLISEDLER